MPTPELTLMASFFQPEQISTTPGALLWIVPLTAAISVVYKATKVPTIAPKKFAKETASLFGSILIFITIAALILVGIAWFINDVVPARAG